MDKYIVQVTGDLTIDWMTLSNDGPIPNAKAYYNTPGYGNWHLTSQLGCAGYLESLVAEMLGDRATVCGPQHPGDEDPERLEKRRAALSEALAGPKSQGISKSSTVWRCYPNEDKSESARIREWRERETTSRDYATFRLGGRADLLVLVDGGRGFRHQREGWPEALTKHAASLKHIILKLTHFTNFGHAGSGTPGGSAGSESPTSLLQWIIDQGLGPQTTVVTGVDHLRACDARIWASVSWERMFHDVKQAISEITVGNKPAFVTKDGRLAVSQVIVTIGTAGAVIIREAADGTPKDALIFDKFGQEGDFDRKYKEGQMMGGATSVVATLASEWAKASSDPDWAVNATKVGVGLSRFLMHRGYKVEPKADDQDYQEIRFPVAELAAEYHRQSDENNGLQKLDWYKAVWALESFPGPKERTEQWSILEKSTESSLEQIFTKARKIVIEGPRALPNVPIEQIGRWISADRREIEGVRSVNNAIRNYLTGSDHRTPLCIGVFGHPGSGKSFAIECIAESLNLNKDSELKFNLSQFQSPQELVTAFHQIRDLHLRGKIPLVFWDEFDTQLGSANYGWLRYFLAPMQDGEFTESDHVHTVGGGIWVFAGATAHTYDEFADTDGDDEAVTAKKPDFVSRLRAYIDVVGPNPEPGALHDKLYLIRRALMLHNCLKRNAPFLERQGRMQIQQGVLNAFLLVPEYKHGSRSMDALVKMSSLRDKLAYEVSSLPPGSILGMHTNREHFYLLANQAARPIQWVGVVVEDGVEPPEAVALAPAIRRKLRERFGDSTFILLAGATILSVHALLNELLAPGSGLRGTVGVVVSQTNLLSRHHSALHGRKVRIDQCKICRSRKTCAKLVPSLSDLRPPYETIEVPVRGAPALCAVERGENIGGNVNALVVVGKTKSLFHSHTPGVAAAVKAAGAKRIWTYHANQDRVIAESDWPANHQAVGSDEPEAAGVADCD